MYLMKEGGIVSSLDPASGQVLKQGRTPDALEEYYASYVASIFRTVRFGTAEAHGRAEMMEFNYLSERKAITRNADGRYAIDYAKICNAIVRGVRKTTIGASKVACFIMKPGYTGTWRGHPVSVQGSGMGQPSMAIYVNELFRVIAGYERRALGITSHQPFDHVSTALRPNRIVPRPMALPRQRTGRRDRIPGEHPGRLRDAHPGVEEPAEGRRAPTGEVATLARPSRAAPAPHRSAPAVVHWGSGRVIPVAANSSSATAHLNNAWRPWRRFGAVRGSGGRALEDAGR